MAVFMVNICKFDGCGIIFPSLADLIFHIEDTHIDYDPAVIKEKEQQQPQCLPLSYVLKFFTNTAKRDIQQLDIKRRIIQHANKTSPPNNPVALTEPDEEELVTESEDSNESWTTSEEFSSEFILRYGSKIDNITSSPNLSDKPFACPVPGCKKRYKNINGIKYHSKNGHKKDGKIRKGYRCYCGKSYKTSQGLKSHSLSHHDGNALQAAIPLTRTVAVKQSANLPALSKQQDARAAGVAKLKSFIENNKTVVPKNHLSSGFDRSSDCDLGILTPEFSPDSSPDDKKRSSIDLKSPLGSSIYSMQLDLGAFTTN